MKIGDINVPDALIHAEMRLSVLEKSFNFILNNNISLTKPSQQDIDDYSKQALADLQEKYPNMGIKAR